MKEYNKKLLEATKRLSNKTYEKAMQDAHKATHPSSLLAKRGAVISSGIGFTLLTAGVAGLFSKNGKLALGSIISGTVVIAANFINATNTKK